MISGPLARVVVLAVFVFAGGCATQKAAFVPPKKIMLIAGAQSHGPGDHEFKAGCHLLQQCLQNFPGLLVEVFTNGWPSNPQAFDGASSIIIYSDGGGGHPAIKPDRLRLLGEKMKQGVGFGCVHYAVEVPKDKGGPEFLDWLGGYFETYWSVNPHWTASFTNFPVHPITRGVKPFQINDEWYYHMRFRPGMDKVTPILSAVPADSTRGKPGANEPHGGNPHVQARKGMSEHVMWAFDRPGGGRSFGFTGGHRHTNWGDENFRKVVLNAIVWSAGLEVPAQGIAATVNAEDLKKNLDVKKSR